MMKLGLYNSSTQTTDELNGSFVNIYAQSYAQHAGKYTIIGSRIHQSINGNRFCICN